MTTDLDLPGSGVSDGEPDDPVRRRRRVRRLVVAGAVLAGILAATTAVLGALGLGGSPPSRDEGPSWQTARVARTTLTESTQVDGRLGYGSAQPLGTRAVGTVTWLPDVGTVISRGGSVLRVDDHPVPLLYGSVPQYRVIGLPDVPASPSAGRAQPSAAPTPTGRPTAGSPGSGGSVSDPSPAGAGPTPTASPTVLRGRDVEQLERNLYDLGYRGFTVDDVFTAATAGAVRAWQKDAGMPVTGRVGLGDVVFAPGPLRVAAVLARTGNVAGGDVLSVTGLTRVVTVTSAATDVAWAGPGAVVRIALPTGRTVSGRVTGVGQPAPAAGSTGSGPTGAAGGGAQVTVTIAVADQKALGDLSDSPVGVSYVTATRPQVLAVPAAALVALAQGGYGLEVVDSVSPPRSHVIAVATGLFSSGLVEVSGPDLRDGLTVRMPQ